MSPDRGLLGRLPEGGSAGDLFGQICILAALTKALAERAPSAQMDVHLDEERGEKAPEAAQPARQSAQRQPPEDRVPDSGKVALDIRRDRNGTFDPMLITKYRRRFSEFDRKIVSMHARGMTTRKIQGHIGAIHGVEASPGLISAITGAVMEEVTARPAPLDPCYPIVVMDAIGIDIRTGGVVANQAVSPSLFCPTARGTFRRLGFLPMKAQGSGPGS